MRVWRGSHDICSCNRRRCRHVCRRRRLWCARRGRICTCTAVWWHCVLCCDLGRAVSGRGRTCLIRTLGNRLALASVLSNRHDTWRRVNNCWHHSCTRLWHSCSGRNRRWGRLLTARPSRGIARDRAKCHRCTRRCGASRRGVVCCAAQRCASRRRRVAPCRGSTVVHACVHHGGLVFTAVLRQRRVVLPRRQQRAPPVQQCRYHSTTVHTRRHSTRRASSRHLGRHCARTVV